jgi:hypothetical protein
MLQIGDICRESAVRMVISMELSRDQDCVLSVRCLAYGCGISGEVAMDELVVRLTG